MGSEPSPVAVLRGHRAAVHGLAWVGSGKVVSGDADGDVLVWDVKQKRVEVAGTGVVGAAPGVGCVGVVASVELGKVATQARDGTVRVWSSPERLASGTSECEAQVQCECTAFARMDVCWRESLVVNAFEDDGAVGVWDLKSPQSPCALFRPRPESSAAPGSARDEPATCGLVMSTRLVACDAGVFVVAAYEDGFVRVCDVRAGGMNVAALETRVQQKGAAALSVALHPDAKNPNSFAVVAGGSSTRLAVFSMDFGKLERTEVRFVGAAAPASGVTSPKDAREVDVETYDDALGATEAGRGSADISIRPDGRVVAVASWDSRVRLLHRRTANHLAVLKHHRSSAYCVAYSPDSMMLASGGKDQHVAVWDALSDSVVSASSSR